MKIFGIILMAIALASGALYAKGKVVKTENGFKVKQIHTYYENKILWGEGYIDHSADTPVSGVAVLAIGNGWIETTTTDPLTGIFKIKVEPGKPFTIKISDGNQLVDYETEIPGVPEGTTVSELN